MLNFTENCAPEILEPYLDSLINKLLVLLQVRSHGVRSACLGRTTGFVSANRSFLPRLDSLLALKFVSVGLRQKQWVDETFTW